MLRNIDGRENEETIKAVIATKSRLKSKRVQIAKNATGRLQEMGQSYRQKNNSLISG